MRWWRPALQPSRCHAAGVRLIGVAWSFALLACLAAPVRADELMAGDLADLTLEQLVNIEVTSVSRRAERLSDAAASVFVIQAEDLRRMGVITLAEALRLAPNLVVSRADANQYAISARGFHQVLTNKMLVLIDGRTVYSPLFSGVFWEVQDVVLDDVERIEVISGPGGTLWGTNAVTGVINVITRASQETHGMLASAAIGDDVSRATARFGGGIADRVHFRVFGKLTDQESSRLANGNEVGDASQRLVAGFRMDWGDSVHAMTVSGGVLRAEIDQATTQRVAREGHVLGRWIWRSDDGAETRIQLVFDRSERDQPGAIEDRLDTWEGELQHGRRWGSHHLLGGAGYRFQSDRLVNLNPAAFAFRPADRDLEFLSLFFEDGIRLAEAFDVILGVRLERNLYTEWETLPSARLAWTPDERHLIWASASRAIRAPSRIDREFFIPGNPPHVVLAGGPDFRSEIARVAELGYRVQPTLSLSFSVTGYVGDYDRLRAIGPSPAGPVLINGLEGTVSGIEAWGSYRVFAPWRLTGGVQSQRRDLEPIPGSGATTASLPQLGSDPSQTWQLRSSLDLGARTELDLAVRRVGALTSGTPSYTTLDGRLGVTLFRDVELSVQGSNLVGPRHVEWGGPGTGAAFGRSVYARIRWRT